MPACFENLRRSRGLLPLIVAAGTLGGWASAAHGQDLSFEAARAALLAKSDRLKAAEANINRQEFEVKAVETLGYPELTLNATQVYGRKNFDLSALPIGVSAYDYNFDGPRSSLLMTWPIYTGGKITAAQKLREAELTGARAELLETEERLDLQLVARYFGLRLAAVVEGLRQTQLEQADRQLARSRRFEAQGQISAVERLSAQVSRDEVARDVIEAQRERESAEAALARMPRHEEHAVGGTFGRRWASSAPYWKPTGPALEKAEAEDEPRGEQEPVARGEGDARQAGDQPREGQDQEGLAPPQAVRDHGDRHARRGCPR